VSTPKVDGMMAFNSNGNFNYLSPTVAAMTPFRAYMIEETNSGQSLDIEIDFNNTDDATREKFNRAIGVPENADDYPTNELFDDESIKQKFHEIGLTKSQVEKIYSIAEEFLSPVLSDLFSVKNETNEMLKLEKFFGSREKMNDALNAINTFGEKFLPHDAFDALCASASGIQGVYQMMQSMEPRVETNFNEQENLTDADLRRMMRDPKYWRDADPEYVRKIENGFKKLYSE
jgi:hypothetical protein